MQVKAQAKGGLVLSAIWLVGMSIDIAPGYATDAFTPAGGMPCPEVCRPHTSAHQDLQAWAYSACT